MEISAQEREYVNEAQVPAWTTMQFVLSYIAETEEARWRRRCQATIDRMVADFAAGLSR